MEGFAVTCPLAPDASRLISGFCSSPRSFGLDFLQTPPRDDALALLLAFGSAKTWQSDFHRLSNAPCPAHTWKFAARRARQSNEPGICRRVRQHHQIMQHAYPLLRNHFCTDFQLRCRALPPDGAQRKPPTLTVRVPSFVRFCLLHFVQTSITNPGFPIENFSFTDAATH